MYSRCFCETLVSRACADHICPCVQCHFLWFDPAKYGDEDAATLKAKSERLHILTRAVSYLQASRIDNNENIHYIPFGAQFHYVPRRRGREVRVGGEYPHGLEGGGSFVAQPPTPRRWDPQWLAEHTRPILVSYVGNNGRKKNWDKLKGGAHQGWALKDKVRRQLLRMPLHCRPRASCARAEPCFCPLQ